MNLAEMLGVDPETFEWQQISLCKDLELTPDTDIFFDRYEQDIQIAKAVDSMCFGCPVMSECLRAGIDGGESGVWGGVYLENGKVSQLRNQHKTKNDWDRVRLAVES